MIADYESDDRSNELSSPRQYGVLQSHKHIPEMTKVTGITNAPVFCPIVGDFFSGMQVTVPLHKSQLCEGFTIDSIREVYRKMYADNVVTFTPKMDATGFISSNAYSGFDNMQITVEGNEDRILLIARYDNLGKGASGAAVECMNIALGMDKTTSLSIKEV